MRSPKTARRRPRKRETRSRAAAAVGRGTECPRDGLGAEAGVSCESKATTRMGGRQAGGRCRGGGGGRRLLATGRCTVASFISRRDRVFAAVAGDPPDRPPMAFWGHVYDRESTARDLAE